jgi:2-desacetyl-2-hydroxyethyl bacteriochlorophyllide A dehydrogenase
VKSIVLLKPGEFTLREVDAPRPPSQDAVQVRVRKVGICGTDLHAFKGDQPFFNYPRILGHELAVEVVAIGPTDRAHDLNIGDRCCVRPYLNCGKCGPCLRGFENCCAHLQVLGVHCDGGMQELINIPIDKLHKAALKDEELAVVEMLSIGAHAVRRANVFPDEFALVIGVGPIGLGVSAFAQQAGAEVIAMDVNNYRLDFIRQNLEIDYTVDARQYVLEQLKSIIPNDLPTVVFDATGNSRSMMQAFNYTAHGGKLMFVGLFQGEVTFSDPEFHQRELSLLASRNASAQDFDHVIASLEQRKISVAPWITTRATPEQLVDEFPTWLNPENNVIKAMLEFDSGSAM